MIKERNMKKRKGIIWIFILIVAAAIAVIFFLRKKTPEIVLATEHPSYGDIANTITATGTVQPVDTVAVGTQVSGTISKVYVDFNSKVKKGQLLAELDKTILNAQEQQIEGTLQQTESQLNYQESNLSRQSELYKAGAISKADMETAQNSYKVAQANVKSAESQLQAAKKNLSLANIYSPIDGTILSRNVSEGQTVAASFNTPTLFSIAKDLTHMQVRAAVDEADIGNVKQGQRATFTVDAFPDDVFEGTLQEVRLQPTVSANVVTYTTIINAPNDELKLKPGMTANITIYTKEEKNVLLITEKASRFQPDSSLLKKYTIVAEARKNKGQHFMDSAATRTGQTKANYKSNMKDSGLDSEDVKRTTVWVLTGNTITRHVIRTGLDDGTHVQVISGLTSEDEVVDGVQQSGVQENQSSSERSPFLPQRRRNQSNSRPAAGNGNRPSR